MQVQDSSSKSNLNSSWFCLEPYQNYYNMKAIENPKYRSSEYYTTTLSAEKYVKISLNSLIS